ncbi:MAG: hypothetical protein A2474_01715 [Elusimicrobia bacterium RIFOXYC2_FULL_34_12]|nr:MAG: hypothetical protein A2474_01715 [Elusimicrobia bacterium RIFOXYC2_FULL_34_12]HAM39385.1 hypothetical protein [Elusimicrobiota bacterium]
MKKILIVEDNSFLSEILREALVEVGYTVELALNEKEAMGLIEKLKPDIVILDMRLQFGDGMVILDLINKNYPNTKIIIYTAFEEYKDLQSKLAKENRKCTFILKPVPIEEIINEVGRLLDTSCK